MLRLSQIGRHPITRAAGIAGLLCLSMMFWMTARAQEPALEFLEQEPLSIRVGSTDRLTVGVRNTSSVPHTLQFSIQLSDDSGPEEPIAITASAPSPRLEPRTVGLFELTMPEQPPVAQGYLLVQAEGNTIAPGYRPIAFVKPILPLSFPTMKNLDAWVLLLALAGSLLILLLWFVWNRVRRGRKPWIWFWDYLLLEPPTWTQSSWVSNVAVVTAVVNVVLGAQSLVETPQYFSTKQYQGLALLFLALALFAPLIYGVTAQGYTVQTEEGPKTMLRGRMVWFLISTGLTLYAAGGQWLLAVLLLDELRALEVWSIVIVAGLRFLLWLVLPVVFLWYTWITVWHLLSEKACTRKEVHNLEADMNNAPVKMNLLAQQPRSVADIDSMRRGVIADAADDSSLKATKAAVELRPRRWSVL